MIQKLRFFYFLVLVVVLFGCKSENEMAEDEHFLIGKRAYDKCISCHEITKSINKVGPHLMGIINRESASVEGFPYSMAMRGKHMVWNEENLSKYIEDPRGFVPYNRMSFVGIKDPDERAALIDFLKQVAGETQDKAIDQDIYRDQFQTRYTKIQENAGSEINWLYLPGGPGVDASYMQSLIELNYLPGTHWLIDLPENGTNILGEDYDPKFDFDQKWSEAFLNIFNEFNHIILVGHSGGGMIPLLYPEIEHRLAGLVIMHSSPKFWGDAVEKAAKEHHLPSLDKLMGNYFSNPGMETFKIVVQACAPYYFLPEKIEKGLELLAELQSNPYAVAWFLPKMQQINYDAKWIPKSLPTLVITSDHDFIVPHELYLDDKRFDRKNIMRVDIEKAGHFSWHDNPKMVKKAFWKYYQQFL